MTKHTPGPWTAIVDEQVPERGRVYIEAQGMFARETIAEAYKTDADVEESSTEQTEANARLITAAPDMYAVLDKIASWFERQAERSSEQAKDTRFITLSEACAADAKNYRAMAKDARAAIAKAGGANV